MQPRAVHPLPRPRTGPLSRGRTFKWVIGRVRRGTYFNTRQYNHCWACCRGAGKARVRDESWNSTWSDAMEIKIRVVDEKTKDEMLEFLEKMQLKTSLERPKSDEAVLAAELPAEEVISMRDAESDKGVPAPDRSKLPPEAQRRIAKSSK